MSNSVLLQTKFLVPQQSTYHLPRHALLASIEQAKKACTLLVAPAGYGKTSLLVSLAKQTTHPLVWLQLDEGDNDPATFMAYLVRGLNQQIDGLSLTNTDHSEEGITPERMMVIVLNQLMELPKTSLLIIFEDYHVIDNPIVHQLVTNLVENLPSFGQVVIASRVTPPLPLSRWRVRQRLHEVRTQALRFSQEETRNWLDLQAVTLSENSLERLVNKTEGWGAGLQLASTLIAERPDDDAVITQLTGTQPYIFDYLVEEVFNRQEQAIQTFLLHSSIFPYLNPETCETVLGINKVSDILKRLEHDGLFLSQLDYKRRWYRYHELFRDFLLNRFKTQHHEQYLELQARAGDYFAQNGQTDTAIDYFINAGDETQAIIMLSTFVQGYLAQGRVKEIQYYLDQLSADVRESSAELQLIQSRIFRFHGQFSAALAHLQRATMQTDNDRILCQVYLEISAIYRSQGNYQSAFDMAELSVSHGEKLDVIEYVPALMQLAWCAGFVNGMEEGYSLARQAYNLMQQHQHRFSDYGRGRVLHILGQICWWHGDVQKSTQYCSRAIELHGDTDTPLKAQLYLTLCSPLLYQKDYEQALHLAEEAIRICQDLQLQETLPAAYAVLGNVLTRTGDIDRAEVCLRTAISRADSIGGARYAQIMAAGYLAQNLALQKRFAEASQVATSALESYQTHSPVYDAYVCRSVLADILLDTDKTDEAKQIYLDLVEIGEKTRYRIPLAMAYFGLAYIALQEQKPDIAVALPHAQKSLNLLEPTKMYQLYLDQRERAVLVCEKLSPMMPQNRFLAQVITALGKKIETSEQKILALDIPDRIQIQMFGTFRVYRDGQEIEPKAFESAKARDLLAYFVTLGTKSVNIDRAVLALWPDDEGSTSAFHTALYRARVGLRRKGEKTKFILSEVGEYRLDKTQFDVDTDKFTNLLNRAETADDEQAMVLYENALQLYKGAYLENLYYEWAITLQEYWQRQYIQAIEAFVQLSNEHKSYQESAHWLQKALEVDMYNEALHVQYMIVLHHMRQTKKIIEHYRYLEQTLLDSWGERPLPETQAQYQSLIGQ